MLLRGLKDGDLPCLTQAAVGVTGWGWMAVLGL